jgi:hypothetical protein
MQLLANLVIFSRGGIFANKGYSTLRPKSALAFGKVLIGLWLKM